MKGHTAKDVLLGYKVDSGLALEEMNQIDMKFLSTYYRLEKDEKILAYYHTGILSPNLREGTVLTSKRVVTAHEGMFESGINAFTWEQLSLLIDDAKPTLSSGLKLPNGILLRTSDPKKLKLLLSKLTPLLSSEAPSELGIDVEFGELSKKEVTPSSAFQNDLDNFSKHKNRNIIIIVVLAILFLLKECQSSHPSSTVSLNIPSNATVLGAWYDDVGMPSSLDALFVIYKLDNQFFLKRTNGDGSSGTYKISKRGDFYHLGNAAASRYKPSFRGLELYDRNGYIRTAAAVDY